MAEMKQRNLEEVMALSEEEAVEIMRQAGILGGSRYLEPAEALVSGGEVVKYEQKIGESVDEGFSIGVWASAGGTVSSIEDDIIAIEGGGPSQQETEAEAEAEAHRQYGIRLKASIGGERRSLKATAVFTPSSAHQPLCRVRKKNPDSALLIIRLWYTFLRYCGCGPKRVFSELLHRRRNGYYLSGRSLDQRQN